MFVEWLVEAYYLSAFLQLRRIPHFTTLQKFADRRAPTTRHDNVDFRPVITKTSDIFPLSVVTADKGYDSEVNHILEREELGALSIIPARYEHVPIWKTH
jgi:hypothetical protein